MFFFIVFFRKSIIIGKNKININCFVILNHSRAKLFVLFFFSSPIREKLRPSLKFQRGREISLIGRGGDRNIFIKKKVYRVGKALRPIQSQFSSFISGSERLLIG